jgi:hypothetical protein
MGTINISEFKNLVAPDVLPCPDPIVNRETLTCILDFCKKTNILQRDFQIDIEDDEIDTDQQDSLEFDISEYANDLRPVSLLELMVDANGYVPVARNIRNTSQYFSGANDGRVKYFWIPNNHSIRIFDMKASNSKVWMNISVKPLRNATTVDEELFEDWSEAIVAGAKSQLMAQPGKDWTDESMSEYYRRVYRKYLSQAKAYIERGRSGVYQETVKWKSFIGD